MDISNINGLFREPAQLASGHVAELRQLVQEYPWCSSFQVMLAKALKEAGEPGFDKQLKKTAVYASDRKVLYRLIMQPGLQKSIADFEALTSGDTVADETVADEKIESTPDISAPKTDAESLNDISASPDEPQQEIPAEEPNADPASETDQPEPAEEEHLIDTTNLEREVLKEVAAQSYQRELEQALKEQSEAIQNQQEISQHQTPVSAPAQPMSFIDFITHGAQATKATLAEEIEEDSLIERFIQNEPKIERRKSNFFSPVNMGRMSIVDNDEIVSETLATIYAKQGDIEKARRAYEQLALKYPEKSLYFAGLIKNLDQSRPKK